LPNAYDALSAEALIGVPMGHEVARGSGCPAGTACASPGVDTSTRRSDPSVRITWM
jgi:hypothetical protein